MADPYIPAQKEGTLLQQAQYWLEKAVHFEQGGNLAQMEMAFKMSGKKEAEHHEVKAKAV